MTTVSETLHKAADLIEKRGWTRNASGWPGYDGEATIASSPLCIEGAIMAALGMDAQGGENVSLVDSCPAGVAVREYLGIGKFGYMFMWNDHKAKDAAEVIEVLRAAAVIEAAKEAAPVEVTV